ncbi:MAG TPA: hypothetical protein VI136_04745, partial [Verrucomicrobiae bacterium]
MTHLGKSLSPRQTALRQFALAALLVAVVLAVLFRDALPHERTVFSNDGPLGAVNTAWAAVPQSFTGVWKDMNWLGMTDPGALPNASGLLSMMTSRLGFTKLFAPFSLLFVGMCAWVCFRQFKFSPVACALGAIAAALNGDFFATSCWGVAAQPIGFGLNFLALAALADDSSRQRWPRVILAGL